MKTTESSRPRILSVAMEFFRRQGYNGTGIKQILQAANAPFASLYHFFPGGKEELGIEAIKQAGTLYQQLFETIFDQSPDPVTAIGYFFTGAAETLRQTDFADACPIATIALEVASTNERLRLATAEVFEAWITATSLRFRNAGVSSPQARSLAVQMLASLEGAFMLCRALKSVDPMLQAGEAAAAALALALKEKPVGERATKKRVTKRATPRRR